MFIGARENARGSVMDDSADSIAEFLPTLDQWRDSRPFVKGGFEFRFGSAPRLLFKSPWQTYPVRDLAKLGWKIMHGVASFWLEKAAPSRVEKDARSADLITVIKYAVDR